MKEIRGFKTIFFNSYGMTETAAMVAALRPEEFLADPKLWLEMVDPQDRGTLVEAWRRLLAGGGAFDLDYRIRLPQGSVRWVNSRAHLVRTAGGEDRVDGVSRTPAESGASSRRTACSRCRRRPTVGRRWRARSRSAWWSPPRCPPCPSWW